MKIKNYKQLLLFVLAFAFIITMCGTASAALPQVTTINSHNNSSVISSLQTTKKVTTTKTTAPVVKGTNPVNNATNVALNKVTQIKFNKNVKLSTKSWIEFKNYSTGKAIAFTPSITGSTLNIKPKSALSKGTTYQVILHSNCVTALTGGSGLVRPYVFKFTTIKATTNTKTPSTTKTGPKGDPIISGTVTINELGHIRVLPNATVVVNSATGRTVAVATTDANGYYSVGFYSTNTTFSVTTSYLGCTPVTNTVPVTINNTDHIYYGTSNFQLTPLSATVLGAGTYGSNVWNQYDNNYEYAGEISMSVNGKTYTAYCIDLYTSISTNNKLMVNGPLPGTTGNFSSFLLNGVDWGKVNYIINNYSPENATGDKNVEAGAIQCAIWYFTSAPYGKYPGGNDPNHPTYYQFLTYNSTYGTPYDGLTKDKTTTDVLTRAWQMINSANSMKYPASITVNPGMTRILNGQPVTVTATVKDNNGNPLPNVTVNFAATGSGTLSVTSGLTNSLGQLSTVLSGITASSTADVIASVTGNYGNLLYDDQYNPANKLQNLVAINLLPDVVSATSIINSDVQADVQLTQTSSSPVNVGNTVTYTLTAHNTGPSTATGILISDIVPSGLTNVVITNSAGTTYYNGVWTISSLTSGSSVILTITGTAGSSMAGTTTNNTATRTAQDQYDSQPTVSAASVYTKLANVALSQTVNTPVNVGDTVNYIITALNNGPDTATNILISDIIPSGLTNVIITPSIGTFNSGVWTIPSLASLASATLKISGMAGSMAGTTTTNTATRTAQTHT
jgi:uncharacterized repeat protein (TIGR01451 family)